MKEDKLNRIAMERVRDFLLAQGEGKNNADTWNELMRANMLELGIPRSKSEKILEKYYGLRINEFGEPERIKAPLGRML